MGLAIKSLLMTIMLNCLKIQGTNGKLGMQPKFDALNERKLCIANTFQSLGSSVFSMGNSSNCNSSSSDSSDNSFLSSSSVGQSVGVGDGSALSLHGARKEQHAGWGWSRGHLGSRLAGRALRFHTTCALSHMLYTPEPHLCHS